MDLSRWLSLITVFLTTVEHAAAEPRCALVPYGRPKLPDCVFIANHVIPYRSNPEPFVLFKGKHSFIRFPLIFYFRSCIVNITPSHMPAIDPQHVWWASMDELRDHLDQIIDTCLVHGDSGWPPMQGGVVRFEHSLDKPDGPIQVQMYGNPDWRSMYDKLDLDDGGVIMGPVPEAEVIYRWFEAQEQRKPRLLRPQSGGVNVSSHRIRGVPPNS